MTVATEYAPDRNTPPAREDWTLFPASRWSVYPPIAFALFCYAWWRCSDVYPTYPLAAFALVTVILLVRAEHAPVYEKAAWGLIGLTLLGAEARFACTARRAAQNFLICRFSGSQATVMHTGGNLPVRLASMHVVDQFELDAFLASHIDNGDLYYKLFQHVTIGTIAPGADRLFCVKPLATHGGIGRYRIFFSAENGAWREDLQQVVVGGHVLEAFRIMRPHGMEPVVLLEHEDPGFPRDAANHVTWTWASEL